MNPTPPIPEGAIHIVVALHEEAKPLISHFSLQRIQNTKSFPLYRSADEKMWLIVSGKGKSNSSAAVNFLAGLRQSFPHSAWLNIGIAGHRTYELGTLVLARKVIDETMSNSFYPTMHREQKLPNSTIMSVESPQRTYPDDICLDMEASTFCQSAKRFANVELIHCLKIISDNENHPWQELDKTKMLEFFSPCLSKIASFTKELLSLSSIEQQQNLEPLFLQEVMREWKFTQTQAHQVRAFLERWGALEEKESPLELYGKDAKSAREFLLSLENHLARVQLQI